MGVLGWLCGCSEAATSLSSPASERQALDEARLVPVGSTTGNPPSPGDRFGFAVGVAQPWIVSAQVDGPTDQIRAVRSMQTGDGWTEPQELLPSGLSANRWLEPAVDATLNPSGAAEALVGTGQVDGAVLTFELSSGVQSARVTSPSAQAQRFGSAVKASGDWLVVGDYLDGPSGAEPGAVHLFQREAGGWAFRQSLGPSPSVALSNFGQAVALSGSYLAVGAPRADEGAGNLGAVEVYHLEQSVWVHQQTLTPDVLLADTRFGRALSMSGDRLAISAPGDASFASEAGAVYVFHRSGATWELEVKLGVPENYAGYGVAVALNAGLLAVGAHGDINDARSDPRGFVQTYYQTSAGWEPLERLPADAQHNASATARYGHALATDGELLAVGVPDVGGGAASGSVYSYLLEATLDLAATCSGDAQCKSGQCVDGVCCDSACGGVCVACTRAKRGEGADGACGPIVKGQDPDQECPNNPSAGNACEAVSACSGQASCDCVVSGTLQCTSDTARINELGETVSCVPYRCTGNTCISTCSSSADCSPGASCNSERRCVLAQAATSGDDSGCTVASVRHSSGPPTLGWLLGSWLLFIARRRAKRLG